MNETWLWKDQPLSLRIVGFGVIFLLLLAAVSQLLIWYRSPTSWFPPTLALLFIASAYGLMRLWSWARRVAVAINWIFIFVLTAGIINPYNAMEMMHAGKEPPPVIDLLVAIVPAIAVILWALHILGKYKRQFR